VLKRLREQLAIIRAISSFPEQETDPFGKSEFSAVAGSELFQYGSSTVMSMPSITSSACS
jgi:hypothetical protein